MARWVVREADRVLRDTFKLAGWVSKVEARRQAYFKWCDRLREDLSRVTGREPSDESVVLGIVAALQDDDSFSAHVLKKTGEYLAEADNWPKVYRAGAATIYHEYLVAVEKKEWPMSTG
jgi:hypothetical protein